ncbi:hypothetical protein SGGMMB4_05799 (plasmid) [Sodalis glossinidius str. 'morsitans']|uniref:TraG P-loop domain-containing protein n=1 Tax=Sodalis glossinidius (strain morsitans) TaxID=343509 RepID=A0A193QPG0_SODGM|nr:hypothetical protein SGGMMB4_05799 [Sodalis glossinidius str. 'morsitans']
MFSLIIYIEGRMYQSSRSAKKLCVIDEGWMLLNFKSDKIGNFIEEGYRTARRHYGAYITITRISRILNPKEPARRRRRPGPTPPTKSS